MTRKELITALEAADGPSRRLDAEIAKDAGWHRVEPRHAKRSGGAWIAPEDFLGVTSNGAPILDSLHGTDMHKDVPRYTSSIDAALTLVPTGAFWRVGRYIVPDDEPGHAYSARVDGPRYYDHKHPAIAICIAALRATENVK